MYKSVVVLAPKRGPLYRAVVSIGSLNGKFSWGKFCLVG